MKDSNIKEESIKKDYEKITKKIILIPVYTMEGLSKAIKSGNFITAKAMNE